LRTDDKRGEKRTLRNISFLIGGGLALVERQLLRTLARNELFSR
jgi:hypothetical protein